MKQPKKPSLDSIRETLFSDELEGLNHLPHPATVRTVNSKRFSLDANRLFHYKPHVLAAEEYKRCLELFERRLPAEQALPTQEAVVMTQMRMQPTSDSMFIKEMKNQEVLQEIAVNTVRSLFDIPEHIKLLPELSDSVDLDPDGQDDSPEPYLSLTEERKREMQDEIQKRIILNGLVHGSAMHIWKSAHYIIKEEIDKVDDFLMTLYDEYTAAVGWLLWQMDPDAFNRELGGTTLGYNQLEFEEEGEPECNVHCHAVNFPVLLHELTKGAMDYLICRAIPSEYSEQELEYYYAKADDYENEIWHYLMSPTLWIKLIEAADVATQEIPAVIANLTQLSYQDLTSALRACIDSKSAGQAKLKQFNIV
jgi:hypothetical protein